MLPTNDYVFRRIFGSVGNEKITAGLINSIIKEEIKTIEINENPITEKELKDDKVGVLDLKAKINNEIVCNIEMQVVQQQDIDRRIMFYWGKMYTQDIKKNDKYSVLPKTIVILIANFKLKKLKEIPKFHTKWQIREEEYRKIILTNTLQLHIIELPKLKKQLENMGYEKQKSNPKSMEGKDMWGNVINSDDKRLVLWLKFLIDPEAITEKELQENEDIRLAKEEYETIRQNEHDRELAELRIKYIRDENGIKEFAYNEGYEEGLEKGMEKGMEKGKQDKKLEIAKKLKELKMPTEQIIEVTGLTEEEIKNI